MLKTIEMYSEAQESSDFFVPQCKASMNWIENGWGNFGTWLNNGWNYD